MLQMIVVKIAGDSLNVPDLFFFTFKLLLMNDSQHVYNFARCNQHGNRRTRAFAGGRNKIKLCLAVSGKQPINTTCTNHGPCRFEKWCSLASRLPQRRDLPAQAGSFPPFSLFASEHTLTFPPTHRLDSTTLFHHHPVTRFPQSVPVVVGELLDTDSIARTICLRLSRRGEDQQHAAIARGFAWMW